MEKPEIVRSNNLPNNEFVGNNKKKEDKLQKIVLDKISKIPWFIAFGHKVYQIPFLSLPKLKEKKSYFEKDNKKPPIAINGDINWVNAFLQILVYIRVCRGIFCYKKKELEKIFLFLKEYSKDQSELKKVCSKSSDHLFKILKKLCFDILEKKICFFSIVEKIFFQGLDSKFFKMFRALEKEDIQKKVLKSVGEGLFFPFELLILSKANLDQKLLFCHDSKTIQYDLVAFVEKIEIDGNLEYFTYVFCQRFPKVIFS